MKFRTGDEIIVTAGKDKGKKGKIERVLPESNQIIVAGINMFKRNAKGSSKIRQSGIIDIVKPISVGNVAIVCPKCKLPTRLGYVIKNNEKNRICKKCSQIVG